MSTLSEVLEWKYGAVADTYDNKIISWKNKDIPQPDDAQLAIDFKEYEDALPRIKEQKEKDKQVRIIIENDLISKMNLTIDEFQLLRAMILNNLTK